MEEIRRLESKEEDDWVLLVRCNTIGGFTSPAEGEQGVCISSRNIGYSITSPESSGGTKHSASGSSDARSKRIMLEKDSKKVLGNTDAFDSTYHLIGPLLQFVQDPRCGATSCFIGSTRISSGNCCANTPVKGTTPHVSSFCKLPATSEGRYDSCCRRLASPTLPPSHQPESFSNSEFAHVAATDAVARPTTDAERSAAGVRVCPEIVNKDDAVVKRALEAPSTEEKATAGGSSAPAVEAAAEGASVEATAREGEAGTRETAAGGVVGTTGGRTTSAEYEIASPEAAGSNVACSNSGSEKGHTRPPEGQPLPTDPAVEEGVETTVTAIEYEAYEPMALQQLRAACKSARSAFPGVVKIAVMHLLGICKLGHPGLIIFVSAPHRQESHNACALLVDLIKHHVPIWKVELLSPRSSNKSHRDYDGRPSDYRSAVDSRSSDNCSRWSMCGGARRLESDRWNNTTGPSSNAGGPSGRTASRASSCSFSERNLCSRNKESTNGPEERKGSNNKSHRSEEADHDERQIRLAARGADAASPPPGPHDFHLAVAPSSCEDKEARKKNQCDLPPAGDSRGSSTTETGQRRVPIEAAAREEPSVITTNRRRVQGHVIQSSLPLMYSASKSFISTALKCFSLISAAIP